MKKPYLAFTHYHSGRSGEEAVYNNNLTSEQIEELRAAILAYWDGVGEVRVTERETAAR